MNLIQGCVTNPVKVAVGVLLVTLFGGLALVTMPIQLTPEVQIPTMSVETRWPGARWTATRGCSWRTTSASASR